MVKKQTDVCELFCYNKAKVKNWVEEIPITLALLKLGLGKGPAFSFLLGAVGTCTPTMLMAQKVIGKKPVIFYIIYWFLFAISSGLIFSSFF